MCLAGCSPFLINEVLLAVGTKLKDVGIEFGDWLRVSFFICIIFILSSWSSFREMLFEYITRRIDAQQFQWNKMLL